MTGLYPPSVGFLRFSTIAIAAVLISGCASDHRAALNKPPEFSESPSIDKEWHVFAEGLSVTIGGLQKHQFLIISEKKRNVYIQFAAGGNLGMRVEAVSEQFYPDLGEGQRKMLRDFGWMPPTYVLGPRSKGPPGGSCNYYISVSKTSSSALADFVVRTFCDVYRTRRPTALQYRAFGDKGDFKYDLRLPSLGLELEPRSQIASGLEKSAG